MGSLPEYPNSDIFFCDDNINPFPTGNFVGRPAMWMEEVLSSHEDLPRGMPMVPFCMVPFREAYGLSTDVAAPGFDMVSSYGDIAYPSFQEYYHENSNDSKMKLEEYSGGFSPNFQNHCQHNSNKDWGYKVSSDHQVTATEQPSMKVGKYSAEERKERIIRYLKKRTQRNFNKTIKYACRKTLAEKRVRVRGRFARNNDFLCEGGDRAVATTNTHNVNSHEERELYDDHIVKIKHDEEDWLQEAMASLMYFPYVSAG